MCHTDSGNSVLILAAVYQENPDPLPEELMNCLMEVIVDVPVV